MARCLRGRAKLREEMLPLTQEGKGSARQGRCSPFKTYLREYRANILESAGWSPCPLEAGTLRGPQPQAYPVFWR